MNHRAFEKRINRLCTNNTLKSLIEIARYYDLSAVGTKRMIAIRLIDSQINMNTTPKTCALLEMDE